MATLDTLLTRVLDEQPTVPKALALRALSDSTKEFFTRAHRWIDFMPVQGREGSNVVELLPDSGLQVVSVKDVRIGVVRVDPVSPELTRLRPTTPGPGPALAFTQMSPEFITLSQTLAEDTDLTIEAALTLQLGRTDATVPDALLDAYGEAIAHGAKMRLLQQSNQPWTNPEASGMHAVQYYTQINRAKAGTFDTLGEAEVKIMPLRW